MTGVSPSLPASELEEAKELAAQIGIEHRLIETHEMDREGYVENSPERCFFCKDELYTLLDQLTAIDGFDHVATAPTSTTSATTAPAAAPPPTTASAAR